jgi:hypothetical protein
MSDPTPEQLAAGTPHGLTPEMCARLRGETPDELTADAAAFADLLPQTPPPPAPRSGGPRGVDVGSGGQRSVSAGAALYRARHNLDDEGKRLEKKTPTQISNRNPFAENGYTLD